MPFVLVCGVLSGGCATGSVAASGELTDLKKRLDEAQHRASASDKKIETLEDRVFLLTDQIESQKVASSRAVAPRLPIVTLRPAPEGESEGDEASEYRGEARSATPDRTRTPFYHLEGPKPKVASRMVIPTSSPENLGVAPAPPASPSPSPSGDPMQLYRAAYETLRAGRHDEAVRKLRDFIHRFPHHDLADNAQYWLGECFYDRKLYAEAAAEFRTAVAQYPLGNKAPDALLKLAYCLLATGESAKGRDLLAQVPETYPRTEAARLAEVRRAELGHMEGTK